ncbi:TPA: beta-ketoacyl synthase N-terminal-like domain-containing protein [Legionella pneumophila]|uniref:Polyketide synthase n=1 Tax=Legionella pneumophila TaxID=446 RepID=A0AAP3MC70_LEGPN|nr:polyketide synthase [Legionella pneumophila]ABQ55363.1 polyketide synthase, type I [Legionella pneumophila str. Corby]ANH13281.1 polyketide synthase [Legionella pneumophila]ANH16247.1 polyketide synthase [Legionella pneumophila]ANH19214.1 polyketide synthase [Legionella pneumophila]APX20101.1 polyketide synthase [Legionella pneumophila]
MSDNNYSNKIAIVGMAVKFPGANDLDEYWDLLKFGKEAVTKFSEEQLHRSGISEQLIANPYYKPYRGILDDLESFDTAPFENTTKNFELLGVQGKVMSHLTYRALSTMRSQEHHSNNYIKNTAVYIGANNQPASHFLGAAYYQSIDTQKAIERYYSKVIAPYISYQFGFQGSSIDLYTACSSSLTAVIQSCRELNSHQCDMAIAGACLIDLPQEVGYLYEENGLFSSDGHCHSFDVSACGTLYSNGAGLVVLKRLEDAIADNDLIHAVIIGSAMNNDGNSSKEGFMAPGIHGQYTCLQSAWKNAGIEPGDLDYIAAHGASTKLGDATEIYALKKAFKDVKKTHSCPISSVISNLGHTGIVSGMASIIKTVLMLKNMAVVPSINFETPNPDFMLEDSPIYIATQFQDFPQIKKHYLAGVSSYGAGGSNTHLVLRSYDEN